MKVTRLQRQQIIVMLGAVWLDKTGLVYVMTAVLCLVEYSVCISAPSQPVLLVIEIADSQHNVNVDRHERVGHWQYDPTDYHGPTTNTTIDKTDKTHTYTNNPSIPYYLRPLHTSANDIRWYMKVNPCTGDSCLS